VNDVVIVKHIVLVAGMIAFGWQMRVGAPIAINNEL
jgi:hypothetical protein